MEEYLDDDDMMGLLEDNGSDRWSESMDDGEIDHLNEEDLSSSDISDCDENASDLDVYNFDESADDPDVDENAGGQEACSDSDENACSTVYFPK